MAKQLAPVRIKVAAATAHTMAEDRTARDANFALAKSGDRPRQNARPFFAGGRKLHKLQQEPSAHRDEQERERVDGVDVVMLPSAVEAVRVGASAENV